MGKIIKDTVDLSYLCLTELFDLSDVEIVKGNFYCDGNDLTNLEGAPHTVGGDFFCAESNLTSLKGGPHTVKSSFDCTNNNLTSLEGAPKIVKGDFNCRSNKLTSLEGLPETIGGDLVLERYLEDEFSEKYIRSRCKIKGDVHYYDEDEYEPGYDEVEDDPGDGEGWYNY